LKNFVIELTEMYERRSEINEILGKVRPFRIKPVFRLLPQCTATLLRVKQKISRTVALILMEVEFFAKNGTIYAISRE